MITIKQDMYIRGLIYSRFPSQGAFARRMKWSDSKASRFISGKAKLRNQETEEVAAVLGINSEKVFLQIFFPNMSLTGTSKGGNKVG